MVYSNVSFVLSEGYMNYLVFFFVGVVFGLIIGTLSTLLVVKKTKTNIKQTIKEEVKEEKNIINEQTDSRIAEVRELINLIESGRKLQCNCNAQLLKGIKLLAQEANWEDQIDEETLNILSQLMKRHKEHLKYRSDNDSKIAMTIDKKNSHVSNKVVTWELTPKEYEQLLQNGGVPDNVEVEIVEDEEDYQGSWITIDQNGEIEEYME